MAFLVLWALRGEKIPGKNSAGLNGEDLGQYHFVLTNYVIYVWETTMKITKNELIEIIKEEARSMMSERQTSASDVIRVALGNAQLLKLLGAGSRGVLASVKEGGQLNLLVGLITNALTCPDGSDAIDRHNRPRCKGTVLNPEMDKGLLADTYNKIKNFEEEQRGDSADALADLENMDFDSLEENKVKMTKSKLQQIILEETKLALEGDVPGRISGGDLVAAITLAIDEVFQESRPDHEAAAIAYAQISHSLDEIFKQSYKAAARAGKMMGGNPDEPGDLGGLGL